MGFNKKFFQTGGIVASSATPAPAGIDPLQNFETVTYTGNGSTQKITGYIRKGGAFNGSSSKILTGSGSAPIPSSGAFSLSAWVRTTSSNRSFISFGDFWLKSEYSSGVFGLGDPNTTERGTTDISDGDWHHCVLTVDASNNITLYVDGTSEFTGNKSISRTNGGDFAIGVARTSSPVYYWLGNIDQVRIFNKELSSSEVTTLYGETYASSTKSTTDIFSDGSGVALYELDDSANDTGGNIGSLYTTNRELDLDVDGYTSGTVSDLSGNSYTATLNGNTTYGTDSNGGGYFDFDGTGDYLSVDQTIASSFSGDFTLEFIIEPHEATNFTYVYAKQNASTNGLVIGNFGSPSSDIEIYRQNTSGTSTINGTITSTGITQDEWQHIAIVFSGANATLYRNGSEKGTITGSAATYPTDFTEFYIGGNYSGSFDLNGRVGDFRIHSSALSDSQILQNFNASKGSYGVGYDGTPTNVNFLGMAFAPDFVWIKDRGTAESHQLFDSLRGAGEVIESDDDSGEVTRSDSLTSFDNNGFTLGADGAGFVNYVGRGPYIAWCWKAGGTAVSNTDGTITSQVSANTDAGFSIVKYTGTLNSAGNVSVGHGLSQAPELIISKRIDSTGSWRIRPFSLNNNPYDYLEFDTGALAQFSASDGVMALPTSTTFDNNWNSALGGAGDVIAYCFHSVDGYQKVGSYTGNGSATGPTVTTGFEPRFLLLRRADAIAGNWFIFDSARSTANERDDFLHPNSNAAETTNSAAYSVDFLSIGFQIKGNGDQIDGNNGTYIYLAIA